MEREQQQAVAEAAAAPVHEGEEPAPKKQSSGKAGAVPEVKPETQVGQAQTASEQAYADPAKAKKAEQDTKKVLEFIRTQAKARAKAGGQIGKDSMLQKRLVEHYLPEYMANPNAQTGKAAVDKIGGQLDPATADQSDFWERGAAQWNSHP